MKNVFLLAALTGSLGGAAAAQTGADINWTGFFAAASLASGSYSGDMRHGDPTGDGVTNNYGAPGAAYGQDGDDTGFGVQAGYMHQFPSNLVIGGDLAYGEGSSVDDGGAFAMFSDNRTSSEIADVLSVNARVGYAFGRVMPYLRAGFVQADITTVNSFDQGKGQRRTFAQTQQTEGTQIGIGVLYALTERAFVGLEYSRIEFDEATFRGTDSLGSPAEFAGDYSGDVVSLSVGVKF